MNKNDLCKPPNLTQFKNKMIQSIKDKQTKRDHIVEHLERDKIPDISRLMNESEFIEQAEEEEREYMEGRNLQESGKYWK